MPIERELKTFLAELQERHPLKDDKPIALLFGGWGFASSDLKDGSIVLPRSWLKNDAWSYYVVIHEYAHFLSQDNAKGLRRHVRLLHNFLAHDKLFKKTEVALSAEYGIKIRRWVIYPREIETPWGNPSIFDFLTPTEVCKEAIRCNFYGFAIALFLLSYMELEIPSHAFLFLGSLLSVILVDEYGSFLQQSLVRRKYRRTGIRRKV